MQEEHSINASNGIFLTTMPTYDLMYKTGYLAILNVVYNLLQALYIRVG